MILRILVAIGLIVSVFTIGQIVVGHYSPFVVMEGANADKYIGHTVLYWKTYTSIGVFLLLLGALFLTKIRQKLLGYVLLIAGISMMLSGSNGGFFGNGVGFFIPRLLTAIICFIIIGSIAWNQNWND